MNPQDFSRYIRAVLIALLPLPIQLVAQQNPTSTIHTDIPVLCYHQVRNWEQSDSKSAKHYITTTAHFAEQMRLLHENGYYPISMTQFERHMLNRMAIPKHAVLLTFDDGTESQYRNALPVLRSFGYPAVFFLMTVTIGHKGYIDCYQIDTLLQTGMTIGCHTWNHRIVTRYDESDWKTQLDDPLKELEQLTGRKITCFAYPDGIWNDNAITELRKRGIAVAFQLWGHSDHQQPQYTIRRILVDGYWDDGQFLGQIRSAEENRTNSVE